MPNTNALEYMILQQLFGGGAGGAGQVWLQVAMLVCLFVTGIYRPEVVRAKPLFRLACILFAISLLISPTLNLLLSYLMQMGNSGPSYGRVSDESAMLFSFPSMISAVLFGLSVICGLSSLGLGGLIQALHPPRRNRRRGGRLRPAACIRWMSPIEAVSRARAGGMVQPQTVDEPVCPVRFLREEQIAANVRSAFHRH
jgi:hypothetical protein